MMFTKYFTLLKKVILHHTTANVPEWFLVTVAVIKSEAPKIHIKLIDNDHDPAGVGEPGVPPVAAAICNAIYNATGMRVRDLPLIDHGMV